MHIQDAFFGIPPIRIVPEAMYPGTFKFRVSGKPFFRPKVIWIFGLAPSLPRTTAETMDKNQIKQRGGRFVEQVETKGSDDVA